jgi:hypothetical protein
MRQGLIHNGGMPTGQFPLISLCEALATTYLEVLRVPPIAALSFLLFLLALVPGYARGGEGGSDSDHVNQERPSAAAANDALGRFDFGIGYVSQDGVDQATINAQFTRVFATHHQVTMIVPLIDEDLDSSISMRAGDLQLGYSYTPGHALSANPWVPSDVGIGIGLSIPTGDPSDGTGFGSYVVAPRLGFIKTFESNLAISPTIKYLHSFEEQADGVEVREWVLAANIIYVGPRTFWVQWTPEYLYDTNLDDGAFGMTIIVGKLFTRHFGMSLDFMRVPTFVSNSGGATTEYANSYVLSFHVPFGYQQ